MPTPLFPQRPRDFERESIFGTSSYIDSVQLGSKDDLTRWTHHHHMSRLQRQVSKSIRMWDPDTKTSPLGLTRCEPATGLDMQPRSKDAHDVKPAALDVQSQQETVQALAEDGSRKELWQKSLRRVQGHPDLRQALRLGQRIAAKKGRTGIASEKE